MTDASATAPTVSTGELVTLVSLHLPAATASPRQLPTSPAGIANPALTVSNVGSRPRFLGAVISALLFLPALLVGCSTQPSEATCDWMTQVQPGEAEQRIIIVYDGTASRRPSALPARLVTELAGAASQKGSAALLVVDGDKAYPAWALQDAALAAPDLQDTARGTRLQAIAVGCVEEAAAVAHPASAGSDLLLALQEAGRALPADTGRLEPSSSAGERVHSPSQLWVVTDGISTGLIDLPSMPMGEVSPEQVAADVARRGELPSLRGAAVTFSGIGDVEGQAIPQSIRRWLENLWLAVCRAAGAASCSIDRTPLPAPSRTEPTALPADPTPDWPNPEVTVTATQDSSSTRETKVVVLPATLMFDAGSCVLDLDPAARQAINDLAKSLSANDAATATVSGYTANWGSSQYRADLSTCRAEAVMGQLVARGVPACRLAANGYGSRHQVADDHPNGVWSEAAAQMNRRVEIEISTDAPPPCSPRKTSTRGNTESAVPSGQQ